MLLFDGDLEGVFAAARARIMGVEGEIRCIRRLSL